MTTNNTPVSLPAIVELFAHSSTALKYPKLKLTTRKGNTLFIKLMKHGRCIGSLAVSNGAPYGDINNKFYGYIHPNGEFHPSRWVATAHTADMSDACNTLKAINANPRNFALSYGNTTCNCMFCGKQLTRSESKLYGYGPICAANWGLPYDVSNEEAKAALNLMQL